MSACVANVNSVRSMVSWKRCRDFEENAMVLLSHVMVLNYAMRIWWLIRMLCCRKFDARYSFKHVLLCRALFFCMPSIPHPVGGRDVEILQSCYGAKSCRGSDIVVAFHEAGMNLNLAVWLEKYHGFRNATVFQRRHENRSCDHDFRPCLMET